MTSPSPQVSVIIPTRDALLWLPGAVASIGGGPEIEIIIVDDGSSDGTAAWLDRLALADLRVVHINGAGRGPSAARNLALAAVRAPLVAFLDADDRWRPGKLAAQLRLHAASPEVGFSFTDYMHVTESGEAKGPCFAWWPCFRSRHPQPAAFLLGDALAAIYAENVVGTSTVVARTALLRAAGGFDEGLQQAEDWDLWLRLAAMAPAACDPVVHVDYMMHRTGSVTAPPSRRLTVQRCGCAKRGCSPPRPRGQPPRAATCAPCGCGSPPSSGSPAPGRRASWPPPSWRRSSLRRAARRRPAEPLRFHWRARTWPRPSHGPPAPWLPGHPAAWPPRPTPAPPAP